MNGKTLFKPILAIFFYLSMIDIGLRYSKTTGYDSCDMVVIMLLLPSITILYFTFTDKLFNKLYNLEGDKQ